MITRADLPAPIREADALRRMRGAPWQVDPDPFVLRMERLLAPVARLMRRTPH